VAIRTRPTRRYSTTTPAVTCRACARPAPAGVVADLGRWAEDMKLIAAIILIICSTALCHAKHGIDNLDIYGFIRDAEELTLYSIDPAWPDSLPPEKQKAEAEKLQGHAILGKVAGAKKEIRERIRKAITAALSDIPDGPPMMCFEPRIGVSLICKGRRLDILVCYQCHTSCFYYDGGDNMGPLSPHGEDEFNALLDEMGVKRDVPKTKKGEPNKSATDNDRAAPRRV